MKKGIIERILDPEDNSIIEIKDNFENSYKFNQVATFEVSNRLFSILELIDEETEQIAFEISNLGEGNFELNIVPDDPTIDTVFEEYYRLCDEKKDD